MSAILLPRDARGTAGNVTGRGPIQRRPTTPNATVTRRLDVTASIARFWVRPDDGIPSFLPGQYFALGLPIEGALLQRPYSTASAPGAAGELEVLVRLVPGGALTPRLWALEPGSRISIGRPKGLFTLPATDDRTYLFAATGTGLAPVLSMTGVLLAGRSSGARSPAARPRAVVIHGVSNVAELAYRTELERATADVALRYVPVISRPERPENEGWAGATGRIDGVLAELIGRGEIEAHGTVAFLCGNPGAIEAASRTLVEHGFPASAIVSEQYWASEAKEAA